MQRALLLRSAAARAGAALGIGCRSRIIPLIAAASAAGPPDLHPPLLPLALPPDQQARGAWQRGSRRHRLPPGALSLIAEQQRSSSSGSSGGSDADGSGSSSGGSGPGGDAATAGSGSGSGHPVLASAAYQAALRASLSRTSLSAEQLVEAAAAQATSPGRQLMEGSPDLQSLLAAAMAALAGPALDEMLQGWTAAAPERPPGFDSQAALALPGLADAAVVSRGGRMSGTWKSENQDAFLLEALGAAAAPPLLLGVFDGHGVGGREASQAAAEGIAAELAAQLASSSSTGSGSEGSGGAGGVPQLQPALVAAFQRAAARMQADAAFQEGGSAAVVCLVEPGSISCAWAGDCRAVVGLSLQAPGGRTVVAHALTQDHKPASPRELARIAASGLGRVVQFSSGGPARLCGIGHPISLALSRALGDNWALPMGLTAEPDAITVGLPPPTAGSLEHPPGGGLGAMPAGPGGIDSLSTDAEEDGAGSSSGEVGSGEGEEAVPARHVLVVACDGVWDLVSNSEATDIALRYESAEAAAHALADTARRRWAAAHSGAFVDDITVAVCFIA